MGFENKIGWCQPRSDHTDRADSCKETAKAGHHIIRSGSSQQAGQGQIIYHESYSDYHERKTEKAAAKLDQP